MSFTKIIFFTLFVFLFTACAMKEYAKQASVFIVFKTPSFKHADLGFIYENSDEVKVEIYGSGQALVSLEIRQENICMSLLQCMSKKSFNRDVLSAAYPDDLLEHIFRGQEVFSGENLTKTRNGFTQKIVKNGKYNIHYTVLNKQIIFRDTINDILIKVKRIDT
ncbi:hypothetical protein [Sulfurovum sp.]|uniref:hypothetical protein n=1 Tax=Sulfurovum sp. TaxID=1969726 RepID=UPI002867BB9C|nr:hypothetical protein [Sulfurovum sp.]